MALLPVPTGIVEVHAKEIAAGVSAARAYELRCPHGVTGAALMLGDAPVADAVVVDLVLPGHRRRLGCSCQPLLGMAQPGRA